MRLTPLLAVAALAVALSPLACSAAEDDATATTGEEETAEDELRSLTLTEADDGRTVNVARGQNLVVRLQANPSTGLRWKVTSTDRTFGHPATTRFLKNGDAAGASGVERMTWRTGGTPDKTGEHRVELEYKRASEENASPARTVSFTVNVVGVECPEVSPPAPDFCREGRIAATKDANGCTTAYDCVDDCRASGCAEGRRCTRCWAQFACIPNGALC